MGKQEFQQKLVDFFKEHDKYKVTLVPGIVKRFHKHELLIMNHLHKKYNTGEARDVSEEELKEEDIARRHEEGEVVEGSGATAQVEEEASSEASEAEFSSEDAEMKEEEVEQEGEEGQEETVNATSEEEGDDQEEDEKDK